MKENNRQFSCPVKNSWMKFFIQICSVRITYVFLTLRPVRFHQWFIKCLLMHSKHLRRKIIWHANNYDKVDIFNLRAIEILENAGIHEPIERQITMIEHLLKNSNR